jgi:predicted phosphodiesterase
MRTLRSVFLGIALCAVSLAAAAQVRIAQLSDLHIGLGKAPHASDNLRKAVKIINDRGVDAVIVTGDIGENPQAWDQARSILGQLKAPVYYVPGNHDIHSNDLDRYRKVFGDDFYKVQVKNVVIYGLDSEVFGNYDSYDAAKVALPAASQEAIQNKARMLSWLQSSATPPPPGPGPQPPPGPPPATPQPPANPPTNPPAGTVVIGMQHIPIARDGNTPSDPRPYWAIPEGDRANEVALLKALGIHHMFVGHWHHRDQFDFGGITWHVGTATSWLTFGGELGFDIHTIKPNGDVSSEFISLGK